MSKHITQKKGDDILVDGFLSGTFPKQDAESFPAPPEYHQESSQVNGFKSYSDPYQYLRDPKDKRTKGALRMENRCAEAFFGRPRFSKLQRKISCEIKSMVCVTEVSLPVLEGNFWYYTRHEENEDYSLHCRRPCDLQHGINENFLEEVNEWQATHLKGEPLPMYPDEVIFLDLNLLAKELNLSFIEIGEMDVSFDETKLAVTLDCSGGKEIFSLFIFEIRDVNYRKWLECGASNAQRAWARSLDKANVSVYTPLHTPHSSHSSPSSPFSGRLRKALKKQPLNSKPTKSSSFGNHMNAVYAQPHHHCLHRIELFDLCGDVLWVNSTCVMYTVHDEKLRPHQVVFHDTAADPTNPNASWICYEEENEAFWLGSLGFTADDRYLIFDSSSTEISNWFVCPTESVLVTSAAADARGSRERRRGAVSKVPLFCKKMARIERHARQMSIEREETGLAVELTSDDAHFEEHYAPTAFFPAYGKEPVEFDLDHHEQLLGKSGNTGGWVINSNARGFTNFALFFVPDKKAVFEWETVSPAAPATGDIKVISDPLEKESGRPVTFAVETKRMCSDTWPLLFEYDPNTKIDSVSCFRDYLLIMVTRNASSEVLFCPLVFIWDWWARAHPQEDTQKTSYNGATIDSLDKVSSLTKNTGTESVDFPPPLSLSQIIPLSRFLRRQFDRLKKNEWLRFDVHHELMRASSQVFANPGSYHVVSPKNISRKMKNGPARAKKEATPFCFPSPSFFNEFQKVDASTGKSMRPNRFSQDVLPLSFRSLQGAVGTATAPKSALSATPLQDSAESSITHTDFNAQTFSLSVFHLLLPTIHYEWKYIPPSGESGDRKGEDNSESRGEKGTLLVKILRKEVVQGRPYDPLEYNGFVLWVPSDYAFSSARGRAALTPVPTKDPSENVLVPVLMIWKKDLFRKGMNSVFLTVYGSYGESFEPDFSPERLVLLDRGFVWAYAAVRGGGELGIPWRNAGRKLQRATSVNDYMSVSRFLVDVGLCERGFLVSSGCSAGGMIAARAVNAAPGLYLAVVLTVPFVDCLSTLLDDSLPLTVTERDEFGDPTADERAFDSIRAITPVLTVPARATAPNMLLQTSLEDTRVGFWEPMKLAATVRAGMLHGESVGRLVVLTCNTNAGHGGESGRFAQIKENARGYAFVIDAVRRERDYQNRNKIPKKIQSHEVAHELKMVKKSNSINKINKPLRF